MCHLSSYKPNCHFISCNIGVYNRNNFFGFLPGGIAIDFMYYNLNSAPYDPSPTAAPPLPETPAVYKVVLKLRIHPTHTHTTQEHYFYLDSGFQVEFLKYILSFII